MEKFEIKDNVLVSNCDLYWEDHNEFKEKCQTLINTDNENVILDLSNVSFIFSAYMGTIGHLLAEASNNSKKLTIRISDNLSWLFELVGFEKLIKIELVS
ncbi:MAG: STAS domain-containing protein [Planctomycetota bacterium]|jgi:anti-anti-sigma factor